MSGGLPSSLRSMVLPSCPMAEFVVPRHSAVMERLRRRIELCRRHHSACESRYQAVSPERLELERQQTFALHQRCLQAKAKRAGKHRQPPPAPPPPAPPPPAAAVAGSAERSGANGLDGEAASGEQHGRGSTLIAVRRCPCRAWGCQGVTSIRARVSLRGEVCQRGLCCVLERGEGERQRLFATRCSGCERCGSPTPPITAWLSTERECFPGLLSAAGCQGMCTRPRLCAYLERPLLNLPRTL